MDKPLAGWLVPWLNRPGWQLLAIQWLVLAGVILLISVLLVAGEWRQREQLHGRLRQLEWQIAQRQQQLAQLPTSEQLEARWRRQTAKQSDEPWDLGDQLHQLGGRLLYWRQHEQPPQQQVRLQMTFDGLLRLLAGISPASRIDRMRVERRSEGVIAQLTLLTDGESANE